MVKTCSSTCAMRPNCCGRREGLGHNMGSHADNAHHTLRQHCGFGGSRKELNDAQRSDELPTTGVHATACDVGGPVATPLQARGRMSQRVGRRIVQACPAWQWRSSPRSLAGDPPDPSTGTNPRLVAPGGPQNSSHSGAWKGGRPRGVRGVGGVGGAGSQRGKVLEVLA